MDTEPKAVPQGAVESICVVSSGVCGEGGGTESNVRVVTVDDIDDLDALHAEALDRDNIEDFEQERAYQRDMSYARAALQRGPLALKHVKARRESRSRSVRTAKAASSASSGDSSPPPSSDPPPAPRALSPHLMGGA